ncbi:MAG: LLM class flavin-dependent oxidoreductase [Thermoleophilia bacterium]|nr:LLM class flavin-dependent oxidoreductase [Thermoleophilia bacterium]
MAPYRHAVVSAKALASLDALSGGRVIAGVASGWMAGEFAALDTPFAGRGRATDRVIRTWRALWRGEDLPGPLAGMRLSPPPARPGGPPVWVGGDSDAGIRRAVRLGDAWHTTVSDPDRLAGRLAVLRATLDAAGRDPGTLGVSVRVRADSRAVAGLAPRLAALGVGHLLVDPPPGTWADPAPEYRRLREAVPAA